MRKSTSDQSSATTSSPFILDELESIIKKLFLSSQLAQEDKDSKTAIEALSFKPIDDKTNQMRYKSAAVTIKEIAPGKQQITVEGIDRTLEGLLNIFKEMANNRAPGSKIYFEIDEPNYLTQENLDKLLESINYTTNDRNKIEVLIKKKPEPASATQTNPAPEADPTVASSVAQGQPPAQNNQNSVTVKVRKEPNQRHLNSTPGWIRGLLGCREEKKGSTNSSNSAKRDGRSNDRTKPRI